MIKLNHADKYYNRGGSNELHVMNDITLELPESGMIAVYGQSGCGKTTLLNAIGGLDRLTSGEISVFGEDMSGDTDTIRNKYIGYIFQNYNLTKNETVEENVAAALRLCGMDDEAEIRERVIAALTNVGMEKFKGRQPDTLSGGQQQRVAIARALVKNPAIILADEPTGNLDEANTILIMDILKQVSRDHLVLLVTHEANLVDYYCDRVIEIVDGRVNSIRDNENANGYTSRSKNDIYLGELPRRTGGMPGVSLEYFGEEQEEITLRIVSIDGKLYLKSNSPQLKILDDASEVKLREGVFREPDKTVSGSEHSIDMSKLTTVEGKKFGRLFSFRSAVVSGYRENFAKKSKKGRKLLPCMILLACVVVFMSANFAVSIKTLSDIRADHNENIFYLPLTETTDTSPIHDHIGEHGIDYARVIGSSYTGSAERIYFNIGNFMTASMDAVSASGNVLDAALSENLKLVSGTREFTNPLDVIITTALADDLIESSGANFVNEYSDLLNMVSTLTYDGSHYMRITGVVESSEKNFYLQSMYATYVILHNVYYSSLLITPASLDTAYTATIPSGSVAVTTYDSSVSTGDSIVIMSKNYTVSEVIRRYSDISQYADYVYEKYNLKLSDSETYYAQALETDPAADEMTSYLTWFFDYYTQYYGEFCDLCAGNDIFSWLYSGNEQPEYLIYTFYENGLLNFNYQPEMLYIRYQYKLANGSYPTQEQYDIYEAANGNKLTAQLYNITNIDDYYWNAYDEYRWQKQSGDTSFIMNDDDYATLAYTTGANDGRVYSDSLFGTWTSYYGGYYYEHYLLIHTTDSEAALSYLNGYYSDLLVTPDVVLTAATSDSRSTIIADLISLAVVLVLICLCIFFIMRSSLMSRVKEIGIYRAIGVSKMNLSFRFMVESLVLSTLSLTVGYVLASAIIVKLSTTIFFAEVFYFPLWLAASILIGLYAVTIIFGTLPVRALLRKTPSEILAKYDI